MRLHDITTHHPLIAWLWLRPMRQGHALGPGRRDHLYEVQRGTPPPMPGPEVTGWARNARRYFNVFAEYPEENWNQPLCGRLRTTAITGNLTDYYWLDKCPDCERIATERGLRFDSPNAIRASDPWHHIEWNQRTETLDPVTGL